MEDSLERVTAEVIECRKCPRLVAWREQVAREKRAAFKNEEYWARPVPSFGDPNAELLIVGLDKDADLDRMEGIGRDRSRC